MLFTFYDLHIYVHLCCLHFMFTAMSSAAPLPVTLASLIYGGNVNVST